MYWCLKDTRSYVYTSFLQSNLTLTGVHAFTKTSDLSRSPPKLSSEVGGGPMASYAKIRMHPYTLLCARV